MTSDFVQINDWPIWYDKYGTGPQPLLMIPGGIGTGQTDFYEQLEGDDILDFDQLTIIAVEPPGYGRSRPPNRRYDSNVYDTDAECCYQLMKHLGFDTFHVIGWSDGARSAITLVCKYPEAVTKLVVTNIFAFADNKTLSVLKSNQTVDRWHQDRVKCYLRSYKDTVEIQRMWDRQIRFMEHMRTYLPNDPNEEKYKSIKCPVLVIQGDKDHITSAEHSEYIMKRVSTAELHRFANGSHDLHQRYSATFKKVVEDFLLHGILSQPTRKREYKYIPHKSIK
ncbi:valacyclovir hydrolase-like [Oppia nitens]|uniref:valacyclovir hydrolase-like n=1 Tax=Oppia nitens TaxID=1686743 RepID=UPI0023DB978D|nr:valacyclovir hydrolase-like [Oppia nitens]